MVFLEAPEISFQEILKENTMSNVYFYVSISLQKTVPNFHPPSFFSDADANADADVETPVPRLPNSYFVMVFLIILVWKFFKYKTSR